MSVSPEEAIQGEVMVTLHLKELRAVQNPEPVGHAEWDLKLWINGLERWGTEHHISISQGDVAKIGASVPTKVAHFTDMLELSLRGIERDMNPDDLASGSATLYRTHNFQRVGGTPIELAGRSAKVEVVFDVDVEPVF